jgi:hypothetical protein
MTDPAQPHRSSEDDPPDDRPSIAELQRLAVEDSDEEIAAYGHICKRCSGSFQVPEDLEPTTVCDSCAQHVTAVVLSVLLEIAAAALVFHAGDLEDLAVEGPALNISPEGETLLAALAKVRP